MNWHGGRRKMKDLLTLEVLRRLEAGAKEDKSSRASLDTRLFLLEKS